MADHLQFASSLNLLDDENCIILRPSWKKWLGITFGSGCFILVGCWLVALGDPFFLVGFPVIAFFGLCFVFAAANLVKPLSVLKIDQHGLTVVGWWKSWTYQWTDIDRFGVANVQNKKLVGILLANTCPGSRGRLEKISLNLCGYHGGLPDTYGLKVTELVEMLNEIREKLDRGAH